LPLLLFRKQKAIIFLLFLFDSLMPPQDKIASSEEKYKIILEAFFNRIFFKIYLPSHDIGHHSRVWQYAKELLRHLYNQSIYFNQEFIDSLIIACYLHDTGMSADPGPRHGLESRRICEKFLSENDLPLSEFENLLFAVENHDNKDYKVISRSDELITILSVADDLDAFGYIGIYRYLEIYIARQRPLNELGIIINENCLNRFRNFIATYRFHDEFIERHTKRFAILSSFFDSYNTQAHHYKFDNQLIAGHCGIAEIISENLKHKNPDFPYPALTSSFQDPVVQWFFSELNYEMSVSLTK
jgi:HD superfamily phosphodiesterase